MTDMTIATVRASSWWELFDCGLRWYAKNELGYKMPVGPPAVMGTALHKATAVYDQANMEGQPISISDGAGVYVDTLYEPGFEVDWRDTDLAYSKAEQIGIKVHGNYCRNVAPDYEYVGVEMQTDPLNVEVNMADGEVYKIRLTGTLDRARLVDAGDKNRIADVKTGKMAVNANDVAVVKGHSPQLGVYQLMAAAQSEKPIDEDADIIGLQTTDKARVGVATIKNAKRVLVGDEETPGMIELAAKMFKNGLFPPNPKSMLCSERYCPYWNKCRYHE